MALNVQLVRASNQTNVFAKRYQAELRDVLRRSSRFHDVDVIDVCGDAGGPCRRSNRHRCCTGEDPCHAEHHSGDACGGESSACGSRAGEPRRRPPSPADLIALVVAGIGLLGWVAWLIAGTARRQRASTDTLRRANEDLETEAGVRAADLRDSNARLRSIIDSAVDGIIVIDAKGHIEAFNRGAERLFGYPAAEVIGRNVNMLMPSPDHEAHDGYLSQYLDTGAATIIGVGRQVTGRRRDGTTFPLHLSVGEMSIQGEAKFTGMLHDLSERMRLDEKLRASEARWRSVIDSAVDGIVVIDAHGRIESFNPAAERLFGYEERDVVGRNVNMLMPSPYHEEHDTYLTRHLATGVQKIIGTGREVTGLRRDGTTFPLHLSVGKMMVEGEQRFTGILHDVSARVRIEKQLVEQTSLAKLGEMAAVIAHEVKNPLAGVRGAIQIHRDASTEGQQGCVDRHRDRVANRRTQ